MENNHLSLDAEISAAKFLMLKSIPATDKITISAALETIFTKTGIILSATSATGIVERLCRKKLISKKKGSGKRGDPRLYSITNLGQSDLENSLHLLKGLVAFGEDRIHPPRQEPVKKPTSETQQREQTLKLVSNNILSAGGKQ